MAIDKEFILRLSTEEKRQFAFELLDSIDEQYVEKPIPEWKMQFLKDRIDLDKRNPSDTVQWNEVRKKYSTR